MFRPLERQLLIGIIVHHFGDAVKHRTHLVQCVLVVLGLSHNDVDASLTSPGTKQKSNRRREGARRGSSSPGKQPQQDSEEGRSSSVPGTIIYKHTCIQPSSGALGSFAALGSMCVTLDTHTLSGTGQTKQKTNPSPSWPPNCQTC